MGLVETKVRTCNVKGVARCFPVWKHHIQYNENGKVRLWMMWLLSEFTIQVVESNEQAIHSRTTHHFSGRSRWLTFAYGENKEMKRKQLWEFLSLMRPNIQAPWMLLGDFHHLLHLDDRIGGQPVA